VLVTCPAKCVADTERRVIRDSTKGRSCETCVAHAFSAGSSSRSYKCPNRVLLASIARIDGHFPGAFARRETFSDRFFQRDRKRREPRVPNLYRSVTIVSQAARFRQMRANASPEKERERERETEREASRARTDPPCLGALISDTRYRETSRPKGEKTVAAWTVLVTMPARCPPPLPLHGSSTHGLGPNNASCSGF